MTWLETIFSLVAKKLKEISLNNNKSETSWTIRKQNIKVFCTRFDFSTVEPTRQDNRWRWNSLNSFAACVSWALVIITWIALYWKTKVEKWKWSKHNYALGKFFQVNPSEPSSCEKWHSTEKLLELARLVSETFEVSFFVLRFYIDEIGNYQIQFSIQWCKSAELSQLALSCMWCSLISNYEIPNLLLTRVCPLKLAFHNHSKFQSYWKNRWEGNWNLNEKRWNDVEDSTRNERSSDV